MIPFWKCDTPTCIWLCSYAEDTEKENDIPMAHPHPSSVPLFFHFGSMAIAKWCSSALIVSLFVNSNAVCHCALYFPECFYPRYVGRNVLKTMSALQMCKNFTFSKLVNWPRSMSDGIIITLNFHYFPIFILIKISKCSPKQALSHHMSQCLGDSFQVRKWGLGWIAHGMEVPCGRVSVKPS